MLTIEKGIPIPTAKARTGSNVELLKQMQPGDSVFFDAPIVKKATRFYRVAKRLGVKVIIRKEGTGMRLWRVADEGHNPNGLEYRVPARKIDPDTVAAIAGAFDKTQKSAPKKAKKIAVKAATKPTPVTTSKMEEDMKRKAKASRDKRYREAKKAAAKGHQIPGADSVAMGVSDV